MGAPTSSHRYRSIRGSDEPLRGRLRELASQYVRWGCPLLHDMLYREGLVVNRKRTERIYREEGLKVRRRRRKRVSVARTPFVIPSAANECWAMDFMSDVLSTGRRYRIFNVLDVRTREGLVCESDTSLPAVRVVELLDQVAIDRGYPKRIVCDNGPEFRSRAFDAWAYEHGVTVAFIQPGKPAQNAFVESFNGKLRNEWLNVNWWRTIEEARQGNEEFRTIHNTIRPHRSLGRLTPAEFAAADGSKLNQQAVDT